MRQHHHITYLQFCKIALIYNIRKMREKIILNIEKWISRNKEEWENRDSLNGKFRTKPSTAYPNLNKPLNEIDYHNLSDDDFVIFIENFFYETFKN